MHTRFFQTIWTFVTLLTLLTAKSVALAAASSNSIGIQMVTVAAGTFSMGATNGDFDEVPIHKVTISHDFDMSVTPVTNAQYEQFDPHHASFRGKNGISSNDDEAVVYVSHDDATAFCDWLSKKENQPYRLPTEAEWEYACRAGTTTDYYTGDTLAKSLQQDQKPEWGPHPVDLTMGKTQPNAWGLRNLHGPVEQWCRDWYGPYEAGDAVDPVGRESGDFRVTRGGSCCTTVEYLRSANRLGDVPGDRSWLIGFRIVRAAAPSTKPLPAVAVPAWGENVSQKACDWKPAVDMSKPFFAGPDRYVNIPPDSNGPLFSKHIHCPSITACPNGDLLVTFYTCNEESGRELMVAATRLRHGSSTWDTNAVFYKAPDRNMHATALWWDGKQTIYHFQGLSVSQGWESLALLMRTSTDNGATWSAPSWINPEHELRNMPIAGVIGLKDGTIVLPCDAVTGDDGGTAIHISKDGGKTWTDPGANTEPQKPDFSVPDITGGNIAGIHAKIAELTDGRLLAIGRGDSIDGKMPMSYSADQGKTWTYTSSEFPPIASGQRAALLRLQEGPLLLISFANTGMIMEDPKTKKMFQAHGMFAAISNDDGKTWPVKKLLTPGVGRFNGEGWTGRFATDDSHAEPRGYLAAIQSPDGMVHLVSSALHYQFNLEWIKH